MAHILSLVLGEVPRIVTFILSAFAHTWYLWLITIPLAALVRSARLSDSLRSVFSKKPVLSVLLATAIGAVSPLCSCSVVPVIFSFLSAGVPLAPVMAFWLASPSMDPEIFFLSVATLGLPLAVARLVATTLMSLGAGFLVILLERRGFFSTGILRKPALAQEGATAQGSGCSCSGSAAPPRSSLLPKLRDFGRELWTSLVFVAKFMVIAYFLEALVKFYLPEAWVAGILGSHKALSVPLATLVGIPFYTTNAQALGMVGGLLAKGMGQGAALAFLIGGATTTLPAMSAVYGIAKPRVFLVYLAAAILAALVAGYAWSFLFG